METPPACNCKQRRKGKTRGNRWLCKHNSFSALHPAIAKEWDYDMNESKPEDFLPRSMEKAWWLCEHNPCGCHS